MHMKKANRCSVGLLGLAFVSVASAQTTYVAGPVEKVSADLMQVTVLGQTYLIDTQTVFSSNGVRLSKLAASRTLFAGGLVSIESQTQTGPQKAWLVTVSALPYVPGGTPVFIGGLVEQNDAELGILKIGGLSVDISATPPEELAGLKVGTYVEISGTQPLPQAMLLADEIVVNRPAGNAAVESIGGTGASTSLQSIGGTGVNASLQSIGGTGKSASLQSIGGTGKSASLQSIGGTGVNASLQSIGGTGKSASLQSIGGTGKSVSLQSIGGTGVNASLQSIGGTGKSAQLQSIGGTGASAL